MDTSTPTLALKATMMMTSVCSGHRYLKVYAPIRQTGTNRIIALAETTELAINLGQEIRAAQYASYAAIVSTAVGLVLFLFKLTSGLTLRIGRLAEQEPEHAQFR